MFTLVANIFFIMFLFALASCRSGRFPFVGMMDGGNFARRNRNVEETTIMRYLLLIYTNEAEEVDATPEQQEAVMAEYNAFGEFAKDQIIAGEALQPTTTASTVRMREGEMLISDGPFAETKEQLGGYYLVNCANLDEAIAVAAKIPGAKHGSIEVRPIMEFE
jgi:hypothetical protein